MFDFNSRLFRALFWLSLAFIGASIGLIGYVIRHFLIT
jgi:phage shock protein PspC (stress-responsive transcriptional regulator)